MSQLIGASMTLGTLETIVKAMKAKAAAGDETGGKYFDLTISVSDEARSFGQNVSMFAEQSQEVREAGTAKFYIGNGKTFWSNNGEFKPEKYDPNAAVTETPTAAATGNAEVDDLPF